MEVERFRSNPSNRRCTLETGMIGKFVRRALVMLSAICLAPLDRAIGQSPTASADAQDANDVDDYIKIVRKNKKGLPGRVKLLGQLVIGGVAMVCLYGGEALSPDVRLHVALPLVNFHHATLVLPLAAYVAFGVFVPFFFVVSGMKLDIDALFASVASVMKMVLFFGLFLVVRGTPALLLYRDVLDARARAALALMSSTQLPLVLAITTLAVETGHMRPSTAAALVGAAVLSTLVFPILGLRLRGDIAEGTLATEVSASAA